MFPFRLLSFGLFRVIVCPKYRPWIAVVQVLLTFQYLDAVGVVDAKRLMQIDVKFPDGKKWSYNPELVHKLDVQLRPRAKPQDMNRRDATQQRFHHDDIVRIISDAQRFEQLQKEAHLWQDWLKRVGKLCMCLFSKLFY